MVSTHSIRFPGESAEYRAARNGLLEAELDLRRKLEDVASLRRQLPPGGPLKEDYQFHRMTGEPVRFSQLFGPGKDNLIIYSFMYGPEMKQACTSCTAILDGLNGQAPHVGQRVNFWVVAKSPVERIRQFAQGRGWNQLPLLSSAGNSYNRDYHGETEDGHQIPSLNVFLRRNGKIHHFYHTELLFASPEPGQDPRHVDLIWPLWNLLDYTPDGRGEQWRPKLAY